MLSLFSALATGLTVCALVRCDDAALRDLAKKDLAAPKDPKEQIELGKLWLDYAAQVDEMMKAGVLLRAKYWCDKAVASNLPPPEKLPIGQRIVEINKQIVKLGSLTLARPGEAVPRKGFNTIRSNVALDTQWVMAGAEGYTPEGIALKMDATLTSRFKLLDRCQIEFSFIPDGRLIKIGFYGETAEFKPAAGNSPVQLTVERKGDELGLCSEIVYRHKLGAKVDQAGHGQTTTDADRLRRGRSGGE